MKILVTGSSGFIGFHLCLKLLQKGYKVFGLDNLNNYYDINLKKDRNKILKKKQNFKFYKVDLKSKEKLRILFKQNKFDCVVNLAAQAGVRYSLINPKSYIDNNIYGFFNLIECIREFKVKKFLYASTSSVYGLQKKFPIKENFDTSHPIQLYAATKKANEVIANSYNYLYGVETIGLRFFTVYGPWGRPDMALFKFTKNIIKKKKIEVFNFGKHYRDFTYVEDITEALFKIIKKRNKKTSKTKILNIGNGKKISLIKYIETIEKFLKIKSNKKYLSLQKGDVIQTHCDNSYLKKEYSFKPKKDVNYGIKKFLEWFIDYYRIKI